MRYVYLMRSVRRPERKYIGITSDLQARLEEHNEGKSRFTRGGGPWQIVVAVRFRDHKRAEEFEAYLKSGSGHAFARRHLW